jgi:hypothetical protein
MSRAWYFVTLVPIVIGVALAAVSIAGLVDAVKAMQRVVVPGEGPLTLDAGEYVIYGESESHVGDRVIVNKAFSVRCVVAAADGSQLVISHPSSKSSYTFSGYAGESLFNLSVPTAGSYRLKCDSDSGEAVLAVGRGIGIKLVMALASGLGGVVAAIVVFVVIYRRRKRLNAASASAR